MFCPKCGASLPEGSVFCPSCGFNLAGGFETPAATEVNPLNKAKKALSDPLFLAVAILLTVSAGVNFFVSGLDILLVLIVIGVWLAYAGATGTNNGLIGTGITLTSVSVKIQYVLVYVAAGLILLSGLIFFVCFASIGDSLGEFSSEILAAIEEAIYGTGSSVEEASEVLEVVNEMFSVLGSFSGVMIGLIVMIVFIIMGAIAILWNILFTGRFSKFLSNASRAFKNGTEVVINDRRCANWILAYGIIASVETVSLFATSHSIMVLICNGCLSAACILASVMMKKEVE